MWHYNGKAIQQKALHFLMRRTAVVSAALVPILANVPFKMLGDYHTAPATLVSLLVTIVVALETVNRHGDQWKNFRSSYEFLKSEKFHFLTGDGVYRDVEPEAAFALLVERCENRIATENSATLSVIEAGGQQSDGSTIPRGAAATTPTRGS